MITLINPACLVVEISQLVFSILLVIKCHLTRFNTSDKSKRWRSGGEPRLKRSSECCTPEFVNWNKCCSCHVPVETASCDARGF